MTSSHLRQYPLVQRVLAWTQNSTDGADAYLIRWFMYKRPLVTWWLFLLVSMDARLTRGANMIKYARCTSLHGRSKDHISGFLLWLPLKKKIKISFDHCWPNFSCTSLKIYRNLPKKSFVHLLRNSSDQSFEYYICTLWRFMHTSAHYYSSQSKQNLVTFCRLTTLRTSARRKMWGSLIKRVC